MLMRGRIPVGHDVLHECKNPSCVNPDHLFVELSANAKLTWPQVNEIRRRAENGERHAALGRAFRVTRAQIGLIVARRQWVTEVNHGRSE